MVEDKVTPGPTLEKAKALEKEFDWRGAASLYDDALSTLPKGDSMARAEISEAKAFALFKSAFQSDTHDEFIQRISAAIDGYVCARAEYEMHGTPLSMSLGQRCEAMARYGQYWRASEAKDKRAFVAETWELTKKTLESLRLSGEAIEFCRTYNRLSMSASLVMGYEGEHSKRAAIINDAIAFGEHAVGHATKLVSDLERALTYVRHATFLTRFCNDFVDVEESVRLQRVARDLWEKAKAISLEASYSEVVSSLVSGLPASYDEHETDSLLDAVLQLCRSSKDRLTAGSALSWRAQKLYYKLEKASDSNELEEIASSTYDLICRAQKEYAIVGFLETDVTWCWPPCPDPWHYAHLSNLIIDLKMKKEAAEKSLNSLNESFGRIEASLLPDVVIDTDLIASIALTSLAQTERDPERKRRLLEEALRRGRANNQHWARLHPFHYGSRAFSAHKAAGTEFELAILEREPTSKEHKLRSALSAMTKASRLTARVYDDPSWRQPRFFMLGGEWLGKRGDCAWTLYELTKDRKDLEEAAESYEKAAEYYSKADLPNRYAEMLWRAAKAYDILDEHGKAQERFRQAAEQYKAAAERLPGLKALFLDHAKYMEAWGEVEQAKRHHLEQEYSLSGEHFEKAAGLIGSTHRWKFMAPNYSAWSSVERAEGLSSSENCKEAVDAFNEGLERFEESRKAGRERLEKAADSEESRMATEQVKVAELRKDYCKARKTIEGARILEKKAYQSASSREYAKAVEMLESILSGLDNDRDREEIGLSVALAKAWQMVTSAEAEASPDLFGRAAQLFERVKDLSRSERAKSLALGHSRFCNALEAGMRFSDTGDSSFHSEATTHLESAAKHYLKADCGTASEYANASKLLFDGYAYMDKASKEEDQGKKAKLYTLAEKVLEASAASYEQAEVPGKKEQVCKLLDKVHRDKQLAVSLTEALRAPDIISTAMGFAAPTASHETATGVERFEHAYVQSNVMARPKDLHVGQDVSIVIEIVNAGRGTAQLTKVEDLVPRGFDLVTEPERYRLEDTYLNMRGRRLDALKTEDVKLVLKPTVHGHFTIRPRIMYLDEAGKYKSHEPDPVDITVKELGISGWLKGPEKRA